MLKRPAKSLKKLLLALSLFILIPVRYSMAQDILKTLASDTFMGTFNGALLGGATMALANNSNLSPMRYGVGFGTLYGLGVGGIDLSLEKKNPGYMVHGSLNSAHYSTQIVLLDTFYGGATGAVVGMAISLIANKTIVKGLQYGSGAGVWAGFGFGLLDSFYLSKHGGLGADYDEGTYGSKQQYGFVNFKSGKKSTLSFLAPVTFQTVRESSNGLFAKQNFGIEVMHVKVSL